MADKITPMMAQYLDIKAGYADALLFYRMGDFYELFFDDAVNAAAALDIALTKRGKHQGVDIPMCGVPFHAAEGYLLTLIRKGFRVAVCEQTESPAEAKKRGAKSVVRREVVRLVTPGTLTEDSLLEARQHNYLAAWVKLHDDAVLAYVDISTGAVHLADSSSSQLSADLARLMPRELLLRDDEDAAIYDCADDLGVAVTLRPKSAFDSQNASRRICDFYGIETLDSFGKFSRSEIAALGGVLEYLEVTQIGQMPKLQPPSRERISAIMQIDAATRRSLELVRSADGNRQGSLLAEIDRTKSAAGARLLERRLSSPSCDLERISERADAVNWALETPRLRDELRDALSKVPDLDRALSRINLDRAGPRDLAAMRDGLTQAEQIADLLGKEKLPAELAAAAQNMRPPTDLCNLLNEALIAEPPLLARDGGFVAPSYDEELDASRELREQGRSVVLRMQSEFSEATGVSSLKIKHNNVLGYFIEVTVIHGDKLMADDRFIHRQTTANQIRFTTLDLKDLETRILNSGARAIEIEKRIFAELSQAISSHDGALHGLAQALAQLDVALGLGELAAELDWVRPIVDDSFDFEISGGRHPVVEAALRRKNDTFVANDCDLSTESIWLLTGPNMAGKSTYLRQNALIALLAQIGSFVPAQSAKIGVVSQLFSRVGASDDLARGRSTFMVEMVETAAILNQSDRRSLVILDEIGRGTATYDGLSIAWAVLEHLHNQTGCRAIFATHYHEMTSLAESLDRAACATVRVKEWEGEVVFMHEVGRGIADRSYGVQVAKLAGLPAGVIARAKDVLKTLEQQPQNTPDLLTDLPLFAPDIMAEPKLDPKPSELVNRISALQPDELTPRAALDILYELRELARDET